MGDVTITGADVYFTNIDSAITRTQWETFIDQAIDKINGYLGADTLSNMTGTAGSKTLTVASYKAGFIRSLTVAVYQKDYKSGGAESSSYNIGGFAQSQGTSSNSVSDVEELARVAAKNLVGRSFLRS